MELTATKGPIATHDVSGLEGYGYASASGAPAGPAVLFVHGWSQSQLCWARQVESRDLDSFRMVTFDLRGHGMSAKPRSELTTMR